MQSSYKEKAWFTNAFYERCKNHKHMNGRDIKLCLSIEQ